MTELLNCSSRTKWSNHKSKNNDLRNIMMITENVDYQLQFGCVVK